MTMTTPATLARSCMFSLRKAPMKLAEAPRLTKTVENPATKARQFRKTWSRRERSSSAERISSMDMPEMNDR